MTQIFKDASTQEYTDLTTFPGTSWVVLAEPVPQETIIPIHTHPSDEYVFVVSGNLKTGDRLCEAGYFWITPKGTRQGFHKALIDVELIPIRRLKEMGFENG